MTHLKVCRGPLVGPGCLFENHCIRALIVSQTLNIRLILTQSLPAQNSPNDLQMLSDAPAHHLFCLLPPVPPTQNSLPEVLAVVQVCPNWLNSNTLEVVVMKELCSEACVFCYRCVWKERSPASPSLTACPEGRKLQVTSFRGPFPNR